MKKKLFIETYGCQMNFSDSEIVASILKKENYTVINDYKLADVILINTCSIRENAETKVFNRLNELTSYKKTNPNLIVGVIGCMAERIKEELFKKTKVDILVGPDSYRDLPKILNEFGTTTPFSLNLSNYETYDDIMPVRLDTNGITAAISIMRGCENFCTYCVVPYTRGKERSRNPETIIEEAKDLFNKGYRDITLLGQNVNSYKWDNGNVNFPELIKRVAEISPLLRVRFATSHPKDFSDELIITISKYPNICKSIHLPIQSGNNRILKLMNRKYTREWYLDRIKSIRKFIPDASISTDIIVGFPSETEEEYEDTLFVMNLVKFDYAYMFKYSERPETTAQKKFKDDVLEEIKIERLTKVIDFQQKLSEDSNFKDLNKVHQILIEGVSKKSKDNFYGRNSQNKVIVFPKGNHSLGSYVKVKVTGYTSATLLGTPINDLK